MSKAANNYASNYESQSNMTWQEKAAALNALSEINVKIRKPDDWYVSQGVEVADGKFLTGKYGNGATPEEAIEDHWRKLVIELPLLECLVVNAGKKDLRRALRWNGYMWANAVEQEP